MPEHQKPERKKQTQTQPTRPTIALLIPNVYRANEELVWQNAMEAARENGANLICFAGGYLDIPDGFEAQANILYQLISQEKIDGLMVFSSTVGWFIEKEKLVEFCQGYEPLPVVSVDVNLADIPSVVKSNYQGMREAMIHLLEEHGYRRIVFLCGPDNADWAVERLRAYAETLTDFGLEVDEKLIVPAPATWEFAGPKIGPATQQINILLNERNLKPGLDFEALVGATDSLIQEAVHTLQERGVQIPEQVAVTGFDDEPISGVFNPPLTTAQSPMGRMGRQGVELLLARLKGEDIPPEVVLASELVVRQSCGCQSQAIAQAVTELEDSEVSAIDLAARRKTAVTELGRILGTNEWAEQLWDGFTAALEDRKSSPFLAVLAEILPQRIATEKDVTMWQNSLSTLRRHVWPVLVDRQDLLWAENLWQQGRILVGELASRTKAYRNLLDERQMGILSEISQNLSTTFDVAGLMDILAQELPQLNIPGCYVSLYQEPQNPAAWSQLMLAYNENGRIELESKERYFPSTHLAPPGLLPHERQYSIVVEPLYFRESQLGFALFEVGPQKGTIYETLRRQMSSSLSGAFLVEQEERRSRQLQTVAEVSTATSTILDTTELLQQVVDLTKEQFGLYHAHIYLLNEVGDTLDLRAGAGETGRKMVAEGWHIPLNREQSLVARAARNRQGKVVNDVKADPHWFANPNLPETRSEMAVPLLVGERVLGVLDVQSAELNHFSDDDVRIQTTLAAQVAITLENARLFEQTNQARQEADHARQEIEIAKEALEVQVWQTTGQAQLNDRMQGEQDISTLADNVVEQLCDYLGAQIGALYVADKEDLNLVGSYSYSKKEATAHFEFGEGLVGQAAVKKQPIIVTETPPDHLVIRSGFNEMAPANIMIFPFIYEGRVLGVIELGTLTAFSQTQLQFIQTAMASIAIAFNTAQARARINELLAETQQQAEELQAQSEELRVANEELEAQTASLKQSETILKEKQTTLDRQNRELKTAQQELETKAKELTLASKYKSEFLANMSHELRTPLNSLLILARMLADNKEGNLTTDQVESAQIIHSGGTDLLNLINDILDLSKVEAGQMIFTFESMPLTDLVSSMRMQFDHVAEEKGLVFNVNLDKDLPGRIKTDPQRVRQIVKNLLSNAFKFTSRGSVSLNLYRPDRKIDLSQSGLEPGQTIVIAVTDTGIGMTPEQQKIVFEAFQQAEGGTSRKYGGTGLGLSISRELATKLGGQIEVTSQPGQGSTFTLYLPIAQEGVVEEGAEPPKQAHTAKPAKPTAPRPSASPARPASPPPLPDDRNDLKEEDRVLLIIEDDAKFAKIVADFAHTKDFKVLLVGDGETGLHLAQSYPLNAIVLDLNLPGIDGWQVLDNLKQNPETRHIPVHIMSVEEKSLAAYQQGAMDFLTKPVSQEDLESSFGKMMQFIERDIKTLLLVEDDVNLRRSVKKLLSGNKVKISEAGKGQAALDLLKGQHFDCMILDLSLPDMSGFEVLRQMNETETISKCPVIVYTGQALTPQENAELMQYADSIIVKGVKSPERLLDETALFLHQVVADLSQDKQQTIRQLHEINGILAGKKILLVDDDIRNAYALSKLLKEKDLVVEVATDGQQALELLAETPDVDLVLMDIMMPVMDGYETIKRIRTQQHFKTLPILALTAKAMKGDREKCLEAGANDYLPKPIDPDRLFSMLQVWLYQ